MFIYIYIAKCSGGNLPDDVRLRVCLAVSPCAVSSATDVGCCLTSAGNNFKSVEKINQRALYKLKRSTTGGRFIERTIWRNKRTLKSTREKLKIDRRSVQGIRKITSTTTELKKCKEYGRSQIDRRIPRHREGRLLCTQIHDPSVLPDKRQYSE